MSAPARLIVLVSGAPGAGKSTLAAPLAAMLGLPLFTKDTIKETLYDALVPPEDTSRETSKRIGAAAMELIWSLAAAAPAAVLEANFRPGSDYERAKLTALNARIVEVYCRCGDALAIARYAARVRHRAHVQATIDADDLTQFDRPMNLGGVIEVDTRRPVDIEALAAAVRASL